MTRVTPFWMTMSEPHYASCRGCGDTFKKDGYGAQSERSPKLCRDCDARERGHHPHHAPDVKCLSVLLGR